MDDYLKFFLIYLGIINIIAFILPPVDKYKAKHNKWRIKEATLFLFSVLGGSAAMYISMRLFHHKTLHKRFMIGIPLIFFAQIIIAVLIFMPNGLLDIIKGYK